MPPTRSSCHSAIRRQCCRGLSVTHMQRVATRLMGLCLQVLPSENALVGEIRDLFGEICDLAVYRQRELARTAYFCSAVAARG